MRIEFIGTGNAHGTPAPGCGCSICREAQINLERRRRAPCLVVSTADDSASLIIDAGDPTINQWLERSETLGVLLSHFHPGHYYGLLGHRRSHGRIPLLCPPDRGGMQVLAPTASAFECEELAPFQTTELGEFVITPVLLNHNVITFGYCIEASGKKLAYLCDTCGLPPQTTGFLQDWKPDSLIIDCNQHPKSPKSLHNTPKQAIKIHRDAHAKISFLSHISHHADAWLSPKPKSLPKNVVVAHDGMVVDLSNLSNRTISRVYV